MLAGNKLKIRVGAGFEISSTLGMNNIEYIKVRIADLRTDLHLEMKNWKNIQAMAWSPKLQSKIQCKMEDIQDNLEWLKVAEKNVQRVEKQSRRIDPIEIQILLGSAQDILESIHWPEQ